MSNDWRLCPSAPIVCLLGASYGTGNMGVNALATSAISAIKHCFPSAEILFLDYGRKPAVYRVRCGSDIVLVDLVNMRFSWRLYLKNNVAMLMLFALMVRCLPSPRLRDWLMSKHGCLARVVNADFICSLAGGDSFSDIYGLRRFWYVVLPQILTILLGKRLTILPQTLGPFEGRFAVIVSQFILRRAAQVYARDQASLDAVRPMMGDRQAKLKFCYDVAFVLEAAEPACKPEWVRKVTQRGNVVGFNISGLLYNGGYSRQNMFKLKDDYKRLVRSIIRLLVEGCGANVVLISHVYGSKEDLESDNHACECVYRELHDLYPERLFISEGDFNEQEIKYLIGRCDFVFASRMHACIAALSQGIPAVGLAYSRKFLGVLGSIGVGNLVIDLRECNEQQVLRSISEVYASREETRREVLERIPNVKKSVRAIFSQIAEV
jgi:colanic acid/amylovoran biosynthesis protein